MRTINKLTPAKINSLSKTGMYADGLGLYLQVANGGSKSWIFRYMRHGKAKKMGLGSIHIVPLKDARQKVIDLQRTLLDGIDPRQERDKARLQTRIAEAKQMTFEQCADAYIAAHRAGWRNVKHSKQWDSTLRTYAYPYFGSLPVAEIDTALVMKALNPIWTEKTETASRVRGRVEAILDWATVNGYRTGENPARWKGYLDKLLPSPQKVTKVKHHAALPYSDVAAFVSDLRGRDGVSARALEFAILTAVRSGEVIGAQWSEIDLANALWIIPAERTKADREHRVPLSDRAVEILQSLPREKGNDFVFIGPRKKGLSNMALGMTLRRMNRADITVHGFRSTFRDWAAEQTSYANEVAEMALAHTVGDKVEAAYRRGDMLERRVRIMTDWARYCDAPIIDVDNVIAIRSGSNG